MIEKQQNGLSWFEFPNLAAMSGIRHGIFTRKGGYSRPPFDSLNIALSVGDAPTAVQRNRSAIAACVAQRDLFFINQVHGSRVLVLNGAQSPASRQADAVITDMPGRALAIKAADCQSILLYDPVRRVVGNIHSGWRGSIRNIVGRTVARMAEVFGTQARYLVAGIGPSLGPCCAEFINYQTEIPEALWRYKTRTHHFDFWAMSRDQLQNAGVPARNISLSNLCTRCRTDLFFSYRGEGDTGRFAAVIGLTDVTTD